LWTWLIYSGYYICFCMHGNGRLIICPKAERLSVSQGLGATRLVYIYGCMESVCRSISMSEWHLLVSSLARVRPIYCICDLVVSVLAIGPRVRGLNPSQGDGLRRAIKIRSTPIFLGECCRRPRILIFGGVLNKPSEYESDIS
jgi:hypothetical protein